MFAPASLAEHTVESLYAEHGREQPWTYRLLLVGVIGALASLPFIKVDVSVRAPGMVRPAAERIELRLAASGRIEQVLVRDNESVEAGQALVILASTDLNERLARNRALQADRREAMADLAGLVSAVTSAGEMKEEQFQTSALRQEHSQYLVQRAAGRRAAIRAQNELDRITTLAGKGIVTQQELDNARYEQERQQSELRMVQEQALSRWQARLRDEGTTLADLASEEQRLNEERSHYSLRAPAGGVLLGFTGWNPGTYVTAGQVVGMISPDAKLIVETQVASHDIGLVQPGQRVRLQVDAYPYTEWGMIDGVVSSISGDWIASGSGGSAPGFKVMVRPEALRLNLSNGIHADLKKGLTLSARFLVARRSLLQLLYDDASAWLNPNDQRRA
jgi:HlyD family secretion protein